MSAAGDEVKAIAASILGGIFASGHTVVTTEQVKTDAVKLAVDLAAMLVAEVESRAAPAPAPEPPPTQP